MILFGIDPGTLNTGFGVIRVIGNCITWVDCGVIHIGAKLDMAHKLCTIYDGLVDKIKQHKPERVCVEEAFYAKNAHTALVLGQARGIAMLAAVQSGAEVAEYSPREIKKSVVGNGNAEKAQVEYMIKKMLCMPENQYHADAYDALAAAICDYQHYSFTKTLSAIRR